ncbi:unnamed protein product [Didymodactylos carnosus]|uniref:FAD-binding domain-containing protein n=1 Tax=Didymodactylos carnosus TaxID=1234261 RepID=A0A8S2QFC6_9BILA|nr:unnamed protein product [Didymodactylos carnosus]CAF4107386.1 unnamed protein product [Didymodactylos carnosus]
MLSVLSRSFSRSSKNSLGNRSVLIVGAGVAGPVLAYFLHRYGVHPVVVERTPQRMGVNSVIREKITKEDGLALVDSAGRTQAAFGVKDFGGQGFIADIEILRGELVNILYEQSRNHTEYIFGDHPSSINDQGDHVQVTFASGNIRDFDLVIGADGIRSKTRRLLFSDKSPIHYLNMYTAYFTIPYSQSDGTWARWYNAPKGRTVLIRPDNQGTTRAFLTFRSSQRGYEELDPDMQKELLQKVFADAGFETPRVLNGLMNSNDFYFEAIGQVKMDQWSRGRVTLVGDAGYCASPVSGMGTTLAFVGAYILAGEIGRHHDHTEAFRQYEALMRPYVTKAQKLIPGSIHVASPQTSTGIAFRNALLSFVARPAVTRLLTKLTESKTAEKVTLPDYEIVLAQ